MFFFFYYGLQRQIKNKFIFYERRLVIIMKAVNYHYATVTQLTREICGGGTGGCYVTARAHTEPRHQ